MNDSEAFKRDYRNTIGLFPTGVTVLLKEQDGLVYGMTANAVTSLSLTPPLLIVCPAKEAPFSNFMRKGAEFTVNILCADQQAQSDFFAANQAPLEVCAKSSAPPFELLKWSEAGKTPRLADCIASIGCTVHEVLEGGDHWIVIGRVVALHRSDSNLWPLLFFDGVYHHASNLRRDFP